MHRLVLAVLALLVPVLVTAQSPKVELRRNLRLSGSSLSAYPGPKQLRLTPAPRGKHPFRISFFGRYGSCFMASAADYDYAYEVLLCANQQRALSRLGIDVLHRLADMRREVEGHLGELTPLGIEQQRDIARRMVERFPEVFGEGALVDARVAATPRSAHSMAELLAQLRALSPLLHVRMDSSLVDRSVPLAVGPTASCHAAQTLSAFCQKRQSWQRTVGQLFADTAYMNRYVDGERLNYYLFREASGLQNMELRKSITLYDLFTDKEIYDNWARENATWFVKFGVSDMSGGQLTFLQASLLRSLIAQTDSTLHLARPGCMLRYGHEEVFLPLVCLLGLNGFGQKINNLNSLDRKGWACYRILPMAANLQLVFYRSGAADDDILFKVLLNENEATLPLKTDCQPYYHWSDFRSYYLKMLDDYEASTQQSYHYENRKH